MPKIPPMLLLVSCAYLCPFVAAAPTTRPALREPAVEEALTDAIRHGDHAKVRALLDAGAYVNVPSHGFSPLREAVFMDDLETAELLFAHGADPNDPKQEDLPLTCAAYRGNAKMVALLMDHGAKVEGSGNPRPLLAAAGEGQVDVVRLMLDRGVNVNAADARGETALHRAAMAGSREMVKFLIERGADINARTKSGRTPHRFAVFGRDLTAGRKDDSRTPGRLAGYDEVLKLLDGAAGGATTRPSQK